MSGGAHDADRDPAHVEDAAIAVEDDDAGVPQDRRDLRGEPGIVIVVAEHRDDGDGEPGAGAGHDGGLLGAPAGRHVAGEEEQVGARRRPGERLAQAVEAGIIAVAVQVSACGDAQAERLSGDVDAASRAAGSGPAPTA
jgi:hypothetical protein